MDALGAEPEDIIPVKWHKLDDIPYGTFEKKICPAIEPFAFSAANVRKQCMNMQDKQAAVAMAVEYASGVRKNMFLSGRLRLWGVLLEALSPGSRLRGRRGADRGFDPDYRTTGAFS